MHGARIEARVGKHLGTAPAFSYVILKKLPLSDTHHGGSTKKLPRQNPVEPDGWSLPDVSRRAPAGASLVLYTQVPRGQSQKQKWSFNLRYEKYLDPVQNAIRYAGSNLLEYDIQNDVKHSLPHKQQDFLVQRVFLEVLKVIVVGEKC